jgi:tRNA-Thr(GGU) m(6)t(6)A37 methyltransferase TsaA
MELSDGRLRRVGIVRSTLRRAADAPKQGSEGAPEAEVGIEPAFLPALDGIEPGVEILLLTWLHQANRDLLRVHPRGNPANPLTGVFATRSPARPNPIGIHRVRVLAVSPEGRLRVQGLEAIDGTPVIDIKPVLDSTRES